MMEVKRIVCHFSCGAASAVATKLAIEKNKVGANLPLEIIYCHVRREHPDNLRFLKDCERWFGVPIQVLEDKKYNADPFEVAWRNRFINSKNGAPCTKHLKKALGVAFARFSDLDVFGFTAQEQGRLDRMLDANADRLVDTPLIDGGLDKGACLAILERAGIELPVLYRMGYDHNNCIGCLKAGAWYWNKVRVDFPETFQEAMKLEAYVGHPILRINKQPVFLKDLDPGRGRKHEEPNIECGVACEMAEGNIYAAGLV